MPYFTRTVDPNGNLIVLAHVGVSQARYNALLQARQPIPSAVPIQALVDTGASCTCVDPSVLGQLNLTPTGSALVNTPSMGEQAASADQYDVSLMVLSAPNVPPLMHRNIAVLESKLLNAQGFHVLLGRDILSGCLLTYDGLNGLFSLAY